MNFQTLCWLQSVLDASNTLSTALARSLPKLSLCSRSLEDLIRSNSPALSDTVARQVISDLISETAACCNHMWSSSVSRWIWNGVVSAFLLRSMLTVFFYCARSIRSHAIPEPLPALLTTRRSSWLWNRHMRRHTTPVCSQTAVFPVHARYFSGMCTAAATIETASATRTTTTT